MRKLLTDKILLKEYAIPPYLLPFRIKDYTFSHKPELLRRLKTEFRDYAIALTSLFFVENKESNWDFCLSSFTHYNSNILI